ncbi:MAG: hypothetical protein C4547_00730 [Phycisphaerales bacterium]|nr:MAG: hypothetical protein C4547_00730 [Phycisphaerales bacterium]
MITIDTEAESKLREVLGQDMDRIARDALVAEAYRRGRLSIGQAARLLDLSIDGAYGFMKDRGIPVNYTLADFDADCESLRELRNGSR